MNDYDVQMAEAESSDTRAGDYSRRYRDRQILLRQLRQNWPAGDPGWTVIAVSAVPTA